MREELALDEMGFADVAKELGRVAERLEKIRADATKRLEKSGDGGHAANVVLMLFEATDGDVDPGSNGTKAKSRSRAKS